MKSIYNYILERLKLFNKPKATTENVCNYLSNLFEENGFDKMEWKLDKDYVRHFFKYETDSHKEQGCTDKNYFICIYSLSSTKMDKLSKLIKNFINQKIIIDYRTALYNPTHIYICYDYSKDRNFTIL